VSREGLVGLLVEGLLPGAEQGFADVQGTSGFGDGVAFLRDQLDGLDLELTGVATSLSRHDGPPTVIIHRYLGVHHSWGGSTGAPWDVWDICCAFADRYLKLYECPEQYGIWGADLSSLWIEDLVYYPDHQLI
jgi:hypothetical protein